MNPNLQIKNKTNPGQNQINPCSIYYIQIIIDHLNFTRASVVQFRVSVYVMRLNLTFELNVMTI